MLNIFTGDMLSRYRYDDIKYKMYNYGKYQFLVQREYDAKLFYCNSNLVMIELTYF